MDTAPVFICIIILFSSLLSLCGSGTRNTRRRRWAVPFQFTSPTEGNDVLDIIVYFIGMNLILIHILVLEDGNHRAASRETGASPTCISLWKNTGGRAPFIA